MRVCNRRHFILAAGLLGITATPARGNDRFVAEAFRMRDEAVARGEEIVGYGPSRVVADRNPHAHAERVALWDAQRRLGDVAGTTMYSTSRPCAACEQALAAAGVARMLFGRGPTDGGAPRRNP